MSARTAARLAAGAGLALALLTGPALSADALTHSKPFVSATYGNALTKCQSYQTELRRSGYVVTRACYYVRWDYGNGTVHHAFVVTWRT